MHAKNLARSDTLSYRVGEVNLGVPVSGQSSHALAPAEALGNSEVPPEAAFPKKEKHKLESDPKPESKAGQIDILVGRVAAWPLPGCCCQVFGIETNRPPG